MHGFNLYHFYNVVDPVIENAHYYLHFHSFIRDILIYALEALATSGVTTNIYFNKC